MKRVTIICLIKTNMNKILIIFLILIFPSLSYAYLGLGPLIPIVGNAIIFIFGGLVVVLGVLIKPFLIFRNKFKKNKSKNTKTK